MLACFGVRTGTTGAYASKGFTAVGGVGETIGVDAGDGLALGLGVDVGVAGLELPPPPPLPPPPLLPLPELFGKQVLAAPGVTVSVCVDMPLPLH